MVIGNEYINEVFCHSIKLASPSLPDTRYSRDKVVSQQLFNLLDQSESQDTLENEFAKFSHGLEELYSPCTSYLYKAWITRFKTR